jgi:hypothetical protein
MKALLRELRSELGELWAELRLFVPAYMVMLVESVKLRLAIALADIKQKAHNKRYHVVLVTVGIDKRGIPVNKLRSINNRDFSYCKRMGWLPKRMTFLDLERKAYYSTSLDRNNTLRREERRKAKERYMQYQRMFKTLMMAS